MHDVKVTDPGPIILVDDNEDDTMLVSRCYRKSNLDNELIAMASGGALLEYLADVRRSTKPMPTLVLLDINMPGLDGFEVLEHVREIPDFVKIPIIMMLTHSNDVRDKTKSRELGADGFLTKPFDINEYVAFFNSLAERPDRG